MKLDIIAKILFPCGLLGWLYGASTLETFSLWQSKVE